MIIDAFLYAGEYDMLELRYRTLRDAVDLFVPVACSVTHQGDPMPSARMTLPPRIDRYECADDPKVLRPYVVAPTRNLGPEQRSIAGRPFYQLIERQQRAGVWQAVWSACHPDTDAIVMVSDVDEIPDPHVIGRFDAFLSARNDRPFVLAQRFHSDRLCLLHPEEVWYGTTVTRWHNCDPHRDRQHRGAMVEAGDSFPMGGWHFSWFGTDDERDWKLNAFSHGEVADRYDPRLGRLSFQHSNGEPLDKIATRDYDWPQPLIDGTFTIPDAWLL